MTNAPKRDRSVRICENILNIAMIRAIRTMIPRSPNLIRKYLTPPMLVRSRAGNKMRHRFVPTVATSDVPPVDDVVCESRCAIINIAAALRLTVTVVALGDR